MLIFDGMVGRPSSGPKTPLVDARADADDDVAQHCDRSEPDRHEADHRERDEDADEQELVGERIEDLAEFGAPAKSLREIAVQDVRGRRDREQDERLRRSGLRRAAPRSVRSARSAAGRSGSGPSRPSWRQRVDQAPGVHGRKAAVAQDRLVERIGVAAHVDPEGHAIHRHFVHGHAAHRRAASKACASRRHRPRARRCRVTVTICSVRCAAPCDA